MQCCPMNVYDTDCGGDLRPVCTCLEDCTCMCTDCLCSRWGDDGYEDEPSEGGAMETGF